MRYARSCAKSRGGSSGREITCADSLTILVASCSCCSPSDFTQNPNGKVNERNGDLTIIYAVRLATRDRRVRNSSRVIRCSQQLVPHVTDRRAACMVNCG